MFSATDDTPQSVSYCKNFWYDFFHKKCCIAREILVDYDYAIPPGADAD